MADHTYQRLVRFLSPAQSDIVESGSRRPFTDFAPFPCTIRYLIQDADALLGRLLYPVSGHVHRNVSLPVHDETLLHRFFALHSLPDEAPIPVSLSPMVLFFVETCS